MPCHGVIRIWEPSTEGTTTDGIQLARASDWTVANEATEAMLLETPSLLITDDDPGFRETLRVIFEPKGFRTLLAGDGDEALKIVHNETVHVVLLDMHMPKLTGLETLRHVEGVPGDAAVHPDCRPNWTS